MTAGNVTFRSNRLDLGLLKISAVKTTVFVVYLINFTFLRKKTPCQFILGKLDILSNYDDTEHLQ